MLPVNIWLVISSIQAVCLHILIQPCKSIEFSKRKKYFLLVPSGENLKQKMLQWVWGELQITGSTDTESVDTGGMPVLAVFVTFYTV